MTDGQSELCRQIEEQNTETRAMPDAFDFTDLIDATPETDAKPETKAGSGNEQVEQWADAICSKGQTDAVLIFDIETGPRPEEELRTIYKEKTPEEFAATCDKRWKPETVAAKYEEYKALAWDEFVGKAALSAVTGRVLLIGMLAGDDFRIFYSDNEAHALASFWFLVADKLASKTPIIGHNSNSFDLPFLVRRSWYLGVDVPREIRHVRYWNPLFRDTMEHWACGGRDYTRLNDIAGFFGVGQKTEGVSGGDFHKLWFGLMDAERFGTPEQQRLKALEYAEQDVRLTAKIAERMGMV